MAFFLLILFRGFGEVTIFAEIRIVRINTMEQQILQLLDKLPPISLSEMSEIKLMNRIDKKYLATIDQLKQLLVMAQGKYMVQQIEGKRYNRYHTIYLDTPDEEMYTMHHNGRLVRQKVRCAHIWIQVIRFLRLKTRITMGALKRSV